MIIAKISAIYIEKDDINQSVMFQQDMHTLAKTIVLCNEKLHYMIDCDDDAYLQRFPCIISENLETAIKSLRCILHDRFIFDSDYKQYTKYITFDINTTKIKNNMFYVSNILYNENSFLYKYAYEE